MPGGGSNLNFDELYRAALLALGKGIPSSSLEAEIIDALVQGGAVKRPNIGKAGGVANKQRSQGYIAIRRGFVLLAFASLSERCRKHPTSTLTRRKLVDAYKAVLAERKRLYPEFENLFSDRHFDVSDETLMDDLSFLRKNGATNDIG